VRQSVRNANEWTPSVGSHNSNRAADIGPAAAVRGVERGSTTHHDQHLAEREHAKAEAKRAKRGKRLQLVCEVCGKTHGDYPSVIANQRENIRELWHRACPACRSRIRGQLANHQLDTYWAMRLLRAETCDVCGHPFARTRNLRLDCVVDHDHACCPGSRSCGRCIRGIIHHACNAMLGHVETAVHEIGWDRVTAYLADERGGRF
jgi:hypothetical protein